jgi:hypothetical protein
MGKLRHRELKAFPKLGSENPGLEIPHAASPSEAEEPLRKEGGGWKSRLCVLL